MARKIICTNEDGMAVTFTDKFLPYLLESCDGIYTTESTVTTAANTMMDGATYQGSIIKMRNIVLTLRDNPTADHSANRDLLYTLFRPKSAGIFRYVEGDKIREISYYPEKIVEDGEKRSRKITVSLICPDPLFSGPGDISIVLAGWSPKFIFPHQFPAAGEVFGTRVEELLKTIVNYGVADNIGMTITITAAGSVQNPSIKHVEQNESITVGTTANPLNMVYKDQVVITTGTNDKHVYLVHDGAKTEINDYLTEDSEFIQLMSGKNTIGYSAASGQQYMTVEITFRYKYLGC